jgi:hypothetical protein
MMIFNITPALSIFVSNFTLICHITPVSVLFLVDLNMASRQTPVKIRCNKMDIFIYFYNMKYVS